MEFPIDPRHDRYSTASNYAERVVRGFFELACAVIIYVLGYVLPILVFVLAFPIICVT